MRQVKAAVLLAAVLVSAAGGWAQTAPAPQVTAAQVMDYVLRVQEQVTDYTAQCTVTMQIPGIEVPQRKFTVYYKRPGKLRIDSQQLVLVPREALTLGDLRRHLTDGTEVVMAGVGSIGAYPLYCLKIKPKAQYAPGDAGRVLLWVRGDYWLPTATEIWQGETKLVRIDWTFGWVGGAYWLPTQIMCTLPSGIVGDQGPGYLTLAWADYKANTGLTDEWFAEQNQTPAQ